MECSSDHLGPAVTWPTPCVPPALSLVVCEVEKAMALCNSENILVVTNTIFSTKPEHSPITVLYPSPKQHNSILPFPRSRISITVLRVSYHYLKINIFVTVEEKQLPFSFIYIARSNFVALAQGIDPATKGINACELASNLPEREGESSTCLAKL